MQKIVRKYRGDSKLGEVFQSALGQGNLPGLTGARPVPPKRDGRGASYSVWKED